LVGWLWYCHRLWLVVVVVVVRVVVVAIGGARPHSYSFLRVLYVTHVLTHSLTHPPIYPFTTNSLSLLVYLIIVHKQLISTQHNHAVARKCTGIQTHFGR